MNTPVVQEITRTGNDGKVSVENEMILTMVDALRGRPGEIWKGCWMIPRKGVQNP